MATSCLEGDRKNKQTMIFVGQKSEAIGGQNAIRIGDVDRRLTVTNQEILSSSLY